MIWRKSTHSSDTQGNCVEVADLNQTVGLRDSKNPTGPHLSVSAAAFGGLVDKIKADQLNR